MADGNLLDAFFVSLGWDTRDFKRGQREIESGFKSTKDSARKQATEIEAAGKQASMFFRSLRNEIVGFSAAIIGVRSIGSFVSNIVGSDADMSRLSRNVDVAIGKVAGLRGAVSAMGGSNSDADSALASMSKAFQSYQLTGTTGNDADFQGLGVKLSDLKNPMDALLKMSEAADRMSKPEFVARLQRIGLPQSVINSLEKGRTGFSRLVDENEKLANVTKEDGLAAEDFQRKLAELQTKIMGELRPAITTILTQFTDWLGTLTQSDWDNFGGKVSNIAHAFLELADALAQAWNFMGKVDGWLDWFTNWGGAKEKLFGNASGGPEGVAGDIPGLLDVAGKNKPGGGGGAAGLGASVRDYMAANGINPGVAAGIGAGVTAEGGSLGMAANGAFGIGQWRGSRQRLLFAKSGTRSPSLQQQMAFLLWELHGGGGEAGGRSVLSSGSSDQALQNYVRNFMRPDLPGSTTASAGDIRRGRAWLGLPVGAGPSAAGGAGSTTNIGAITVNVPSGDPATIARELPRAIRKRGLVVQTSSGMDQ